MKLKIGARVSNLSLIQVKEILSLLKKKKLQFDYEIKTYLTPGDRDKKTSIEKVEGTDFFTKDIERALLRDEIDIAIHSAKDLPEEINSNLYIAAITRGVDNRDVLVVNKRFKKYVNKKNPLLFLPDNFIIGTSSKNRKDQIKRMRNDIEVVDIRGTIEERIKLVENGIVDGIIIAAAGLIRLGLKDKIDAYLSFAPSPLQGRLAIEVKKSNTELIKIFSMIDDRINWGKVFIIGAGPGATDLITMRAYKILKSCNVILYDCLINKELLNDFNAQKILIGKRKGKYILSQNDINKKMVDLAHKGLNVVRLKGGDPAIFAQLVEEIKYLKRNFIQYEIIPGVPSFTAAACFSDISLTEKNKRSFFIVSTGYPLSNVYLPDKKFNGTIIYLMCGDTIKKIIKKLLEKGWNKKTDIALVSNASLYNQKIIRFKFKDIINDILSIPKPVLAIIGKNLFKFKKDIYSWFEKKEKILFTGTNPENYRNIGEIIHQPLIKIKPKNWQIKRNEILKYDVFIFTSKHTVKFFFAKLFEAGLDARILKDKIICSIGKVTSEELKTFGILPNIESFFQTGNDIYKIFIQKKIKNKNIFYPCSNLTNDLLIDKLKKLNNNVIKKVIYINEMLKNLEKKDMIFIDKVFFTSPSTIKNFKKLYGFLPDYDKVKTIGPVTLEAFKNEKVSKI